MSRRLLLLSFTLPVALSAALVSAPPASAQVGRALLPVELGSLPGFPSSEAVAINRHGQVAGTASRPDGQTRAFLWQGGRIRALGPFPGQHVTAVDINDVGQVLVRSSTSATSPDVQGFIWHRGRVVALGPFHDGLELVKINNRGQVLARALTPGEPARNGLWSRGRWTELLSLPGHRPGPADDLNDAGDVSGSSTDATGNVSRPVVWLGGRSQPVSIGAAGFGPTSINERGQVALSVSAGAGVAKAAIWFRGRLRLLSASNSNALDINDHGSVAGQSEPAGHSDLSATVFERGRARELPAPAGDSWTVARWINERGQVLGHASRPVGDDYDVHPLAWQGRRVFPLAPIEGDTTAWGRELDDRGRIVGSSRSADGSTVRAVLWTLPG